MKLSTKGQYAVMALADIASQDPQVPVCLTDIAKRQSLPLSYLEQIFAQLKKKGIVKSIRGQQGGYILAYPATELKILKIIQAIEEKIQTTRCSLQSKLSCQGKTTRCLTHNLWAGLENNIGSYLNSISLQDICTGHLPVMPSAPLPLPSYLQERYR